MKTIQIEPPFSEDKAKEVIIKLCEIAGHKDGMVKVWISDASPAKFYAVFNKTISKKPLEGTDEWTFKREELDEIDRIGQKGTENIEIKLANKLLNNDQRAL